MNTTLKRIAVGLLSLAFVLTAVPFAPQKTAEADDDRVIVVSLGDSYASGEGNEPFFGQEITDILERRENTQAWEDWLAHRSKVAWSARLYVDEESTGRCVPMQRGVNWYFTAASGAVTANIVKTPYNPNPSEQIRPGEQEKKYDRDGVSGTYYLPGQLNIFDSGLFDPEDVDFVTVSIGGNDVGFAHILNLAATNTPFSSDLYDNIDKKLRHFYDPGSTHDDILDAYLRIHAAAPNATIIVVGYPKLLSLDSTIGCPLFNQNERVFIDGAASEFNKRLRLLVEECRKGYGVDIVFCSVEEAFDGHEAYSILHESYLNPIYFGKKSQDLLDHIILKGPDRDLVSNYSMHPNEAGLKAYAQCVQKKINDPWSDLEEVQQTDQILTADLWTAIDLSGFRRYIGMSYSSIEGIMGALKTVEVEYEIGMLYSFIFEDTSLQFSFDADLEQALYETDDSRYGSIPASIAKRYLDGDEQCNGICIPSLKLTGFRGTVNAKDIGAEFFKDEEYEDLWLAFVTRNGLQYEFICDDRYGNISENEPCWITVPSTGESAGASGRHDTFRDMIGNDGCYADIVSNFKQRYEQFFADMGYDVTVTDGFYCLRDLNTDGVNELVLSTDGMHIDALYTRDGQNVIELYFRGRHGDLGVTSNGFIYESYKGIRMYALRNGELIELYAMDQGGSWEELERQDFAERERRGIGKTDMVFDFRKYL